LYRVCIHILSFQQFPTWLLSLFSFLWLKWDGSCLLWSLWARIKMITLTELFLLALQFLDISMISFLEVKMFLRVIFWLSFVKLLLQFFTTYSSIFAWVLNQNYFTKCLFWFKWKVLEKKPASTPKSVVH